MPPKLSWKLLASPFFNAYHCAKVHQKIRVSPREKSLFFCQLLSSLLILYQIIVAKKFNPTYVLVIVFLFACLSRFFGFLIRKRMIIFLLDLFLSCTTVCFFFLLILIFNSFYFVKIVQNELIEFLQYLYEWKLWFVYKACI